MRWGGLVIGIVALGLVSPNDTSAQQVRRTGRGTPRLDARLSEILSDRSYHILSNDTLITRADTLDGPVLTLGNRLVIEGTVTGTLAIVDANVYIRPTARIEGEVINIGGGFYRSEQSTITGQITDQPLAPYHVEKEGEVITISGDVDHKFVRLDLKPPSANRVEGIKPYLGAIVGPPPFGKWSVELQGWGAYGFQADTWEQGLQGGGELRLRRGLTHLGVGIEEVTWTYDGWNRSDLDNTSTFILRGKDYRNYYEANRQYVALSRDLMRGGHEGVLSLRGQREDAESLVGTEPWVLFEPDSFRINPRIDDGVIGSAILSLRGSWTGVASIAHYDGAFEVARDGWWGGEHDFNTFRIWGEWAMRAFANHTLEIEGYFQGPIGTDSLPRQRWSILGGSGTLYTFEIGEFDGDRVAYVENKYSIPFARRFRLPIVGQPRIQLFHHVGMAWSFGEDLPLEQNVGIKVQFPLVYARVVTNPANTDDTKFSVGVSFPRRAYPWERRSDEPDRIRR